VQSRVIYFNEKLHRYTDDFGNPYTSATTLYGKYIDKFDNKTIAKACEAIGRNPNHPKYSIYKNKTRFQIQKEWDLAAKKGQDRGNVKHGFLECATKEATGYKLIEGTDFINDRLYTIDNILQGHDYGLLSIDTFRQLGVEEKYPKIFDALVKLTNKGYKIYAEIGAYMYETLISGLIDLLAVRGNEFIIFDWKTNRDDIRFESGYFEKDRFGNPSDRFIFKNGTFNYPLNHIPDSTGHKYTIQLSIYDYLVEQFGLVCKGNLLFHIRHEVYSIEDNVPTSYIGKEKVDILPIQYLKSDVELMINHFVKEKQGNNLTMKFN